MARANRHFIPGFIWHLTHRCHKKEFLLKFARDRKRWIDLLFESRRRFGLSVLNFTVTSNHVHLIVSDNSAKDAIPKAMQLIAGRTGQEYNRRKNRKGAFWEDRYHATAIETGDHLWRCMVYVDLNMVRAGVVDHPAKWKWCGYQEIQRPKERYRIIDHSLLRTLLFVETDERLAEIHRQWVDSELEKDMKRQVCFSKALAVGSKGFINKLSESLGVRARGRMAHEIVGGTFQLKEAVTVYSSNGTQSTQMPEENEAESNLIPWDRPFA